MQLIGLCGVAGSGKDSVADHLCAKHGFVRYEFARPIKAMLSAIGVDANNRETKEAPHPVFGVSPRRMAQTLGTEWMRDTICADGWLRCADEFLRFQKPQFDPDAQVAAGIVITDCRFIDEAAFIAGRNGTLWHIDRPGVDPVEAHSSEAGLGRYPGDVVIVNDNTIDALHYRVDQAMRGHYVVRF